MIRSWRALVWLVSPPHTTVLLIGYNTLLTLVPSQFQARSELGSDVVFVTSLAQEGVNGLEFGPALLHGHFRQVCRRFNMAIHHKLYLYAMYTNLYMCVRELSILRETEIMNIHLPVKKVMPTLKVCKERNATLKFRYLLYRYGLEATVLHRATGITTHTAWLNDDR